MFHILGLFSQNTLFWRRFRFNKHHQPCKTYFSNNKKQQSVNKTFNTQRKWKWMDIPSAIEMKRGHASERDRQKSATKMKMPLKWITFNNLFWDRSQTVFLNFINFIGIFIFGALFQSVYFIGTFPFHFWGTWSVHPFHRHFLYIWNFFNN